MLVRSPQRLLRTRRLRDAAALIHQPFRQPELLVSPIELTRAVNGEHAGGLLGQADRRAKNRANRGDSRDGGHFQVLTERCVIQCRRPILSEYHRWSVNALGHEHAWEQFVLHLRPDLYRAVDARSRGAARCSQPRQLGAPRSKWPSFGCLTPQVTIRFPQVFQSTVRASATRSSRSGRALVEARANPILGRCVRNWRPVRPDRPPGERQFANEYLSQ